jgi:hypothetical protein
MSDVEFDTDIQGNPRYSSPTKSGGSSVPFGQPQSIESVGMARWLIRHGVVNSDSGAKVILVGVVCVNFIAMGLILYLYVL